MRRWALRVWQPLTFDLVRLEHTHWHMCVLFTSVFHDIEVVDASGIAASLEAKSTKQDTDKVKLYL